MNTRASLAFLYAKNKTIPLRVISLVFSLCLFSIKHTNEIYKCK